MNSTFILENKCCRQCWIFFWLVLHRFFFRISPEKLASKKSFFQAKKRSLYHHEKNLVLHIKSKIVPTIVCFEIGFFQLLFFSIFIFVGKIVKFWQFSFKREDCDFFSFPKNVLDFFSRSVRENTISLTNCSFEKKALFFFNFFVFNFKEINTQLECSPETKN